MRDKLSQIFIWLGFVLTACVFVYPSFMNSLYNIQQVQMIGSYTSEVETMDEDAIEREFSRAAAYNEKVAKSQESVAFFYQGADATDAEYDSILTMGGRRDTIGYIEVPSADIYLPVAHGTKTDILQSEAGHMYGSSIPVGGASTHAIIAGHTGLKTADLFTHLTDTKEGDVFYMHVLNKTLTYTVDQIVVVLPEDEDAYLQITPGEDYISLYTCTPYGVNDHRLIVRGHRTSTEQRQNTRNAETLRYAHINREAVFYTVFFAGIPVIVFVIGGVIVLRPNKATQNKKHQKEATT